MLADLSLDSTYEEFAGFANATWHATPRLDLALGGRASHNKQVASQLSDGPLVGGLDPLRRRGVLGESVHLFLRAAFRAGEERVGLRPRRHRLPAGRPQRASAGGPGRTFRGTYDSDRLTSYELGLKTGGGPADKFSLDLSGFYLDWEDIQLLAGGEQLRDQRQRRNRREQGPRAGGQRLSDERPGACP